MTRKETPEIKQNQKNWGCDYLQSILVTEFSLG